MDICSHLDVSLRAKQYTVMKNKLAEKEKKVSKKHIQQHNPVIWIDNFNRNFGNPFYRIATGSFKEANFTAVALLDSPGPPPLLPFTTINNFNIPVMSESILSRESLIVCAALFSQFNNYTCTRFYDTSAAHSTIQSLLLDQDTEMLSLTSIKILSRTLVKSTLSTNIVW